MIAVRLSADCPHCASPLVLRHRRRDRKSFLGCSGYPSCAFVEDVNPHLQELARDLRELRDRDGYDQRDIDRELREVVALAHPDRWPRAQELAHEVCVRLNALRRRVS